MENALALWRQGGRRSQHAVARGIGPTLSDGGELLVRAERGRQAAQQVVGRGQASRPNGQGSVGGLRGLQPREPGPQRRPAGDGLGGDEQLLGAREELQVLRLVGPREEAVHRQELGARLLAVGDGDLPPGLDGPEGPDLKPAAVLGPAPGREGVLGVDLTGGGPGCWRLWLVVEDVREGQQRPLGVVHRERPADDTTHRPTSPAP
mmetsp:Transcript_17161/g.53821  ORF Transcript_17161/g.53821 Transcript_17161/m.53821 type:complete len:206 (-) Transcript_17161:197-814(-)